MIDDRRFSLIECAQYLQDNPLVYTFTDNTTLDFDIIDIGEYFYTKMKRQPKYDARLIFADPIESLTGLWRAYVNRTKDNYTRIKNALALSYEVLDNYNGTLESTTTDTFDKTDTHTYNNRQDTTTLNHSDNLTFNNRLDTETHNTTDRDESDPNAPKTTTTVHNEHRTESHYTTGYNSDTAVLSTEDVITQSGEDGNDEEITESGAYNHTRTGTITNGKSGSESTQHSGTITHGKSGNETDAQGGTIEHEYYEHKHGNLGITTSQQMLQSEIDLRLTEQLKDIIMKGFIDRYGFY